jgi:hypothetical protein
MGGTERGGGAPKPPERRRAVPSAVDYLRGDRHFNLSAEWRLGRPPQYETVETAPGQLFLKKISESIIMATDSLKVFFS